MGRVFAYEDHNGWKDCMFLTDHKLSDRERFCPRCELWSEFISEIHSYNMLIDVLNEHGITEDDEVLADTYDKLVSEYKEYSAENYKREFTPRDELEVGLFFFVDGNFAFSGCALTDAEKYGDFLVYPESHYDVWNRYESIVFAGKKGKVDYDYFPRGRIVYRKSDDTFIIYYDKCVEDELDRIARDYEGYNVKFELDEHYCCHKCNPYYVM